MGLGESWRGQNHCRGSGNGCQGTHLRKVLKAGPDTRSSFGWCRRESVTS